MAGYLISRAAEHPPILSLMVAIAAVQAFGIGRPIAALPRAARLARPRAALARPVADAVLRAHRAARAGGARELPQGRPARAHGRRRRRPAEPVPARPAARRSWRCSPAPSSVGVAAAFVPAAGLVLAVGLLTGGLAVPALSGVLGARAGRRQAGRARRAVGRARRAARGRPRARRLRRRASRPGARPRRGRLARQAGAARRARRPASATRAGMLVTGVTVAGVLAVAVGASAARTSSTTC